jgi:putative ABC transport system permease protein
VPVAQLLDQVGQDIRYALRGLRKSPGFTAAVVLTIGLGVGANVAMFGVVDRLMFRPYAHLTDPGTVHRIYFQGIDRRGSYTRPSYEYTRYEDLKRWTHSFSHYAAFANFNMAVGVGEATRNQQVSVVSASLFDFFDARPVAGRFFTAAEDTTPRGANVVVLGHSFWQREFGGADVIGRSLHVGALVATIIGVAPPGFSAIADAEPAAFVPITTYAGSRNNSDASTYYTRYDWGWMSAIVRRKPGVSLEQATADATQSAVKSHEANRALDASEPTMQVARPRAIVGALKLSAGPEPSLEARTALWVSGVAVLVLLIACANVANLLLARALRRRREIAVRLALGVSRARLIRQALTESLLLSLLGTAVGLVVAVWGGAAIRSLLANSAASLEVFSDWRTLRLALAASMATALFIGVLPAFLSTRTDLATALRSGGRGSTQAGSIARTGLLVAQGALSVVLLIGAGLFVRSLDRVQSMRLGYDAEKILVISRSNRGMQFDDSANVRLRRQLLARAQTIPAVEYAASTQNAPFVSTSSTDLFVAGIDSVRRLGQFTFQTATADYFKVMSTRIVRGRGFTTEDRGTSPRVVVVSEGMARALWPGTQALGQCIRVGADTAPCSTVIGVAEDIVQRDLASDKRYHYYMPLEQYRPTSSAWLLLKMRGDPRLQAEEVRKALQSIMPGVSYVTTQPLSEVVNGAQRSWKLGATMFVAFGVLALIVAAMGLYAVVAYSVTQRMHELGVRVALGAQARDIARLVVGQGTVFAAAGIVAGTIIALGAARWVEPLLFRQSAKDPYVYGFVALVLLIVSVAATLSPAVRAAKADPNTALRADS